MARGFASASNERLTATLAPFTGTPCSFGCWFKYPSTGTVLIMLGIYLNGGNMRWLRVNASGDLQGRIRNGGIADWGNVAASTGVWHHACFVSASDSDHSIFLDGANEVNITPTMAPSSPTTVQIGDANAVTAPFNGEITEVFAYDIALANSEVAALGATYSPQLVHPQNLQMYLPLIRDDDVDLITGTSFTPAGTPTIEPHPRIIRPTPPFISFPSAAAPATRRVSLGSRFVDESRVVLIG